jgi:hypothetical protein
VSGGVADDGLLDPEDAPGDALERLDLVTAPGELWRLHW